MIPDATANFESLDIDLSGFSVEDRDQLARYTMLVTNERLNRRDAAIRKMLNGKNGGGHGHGVGGGGDMEMRDPQDSIEGL